MEDVGLTKELLQRNGLWQGDLFTSVFHLISECRQSQYEMRYAVFKQKVDSYDQSEHGEMYEYLGLPKNVFDMWIDGKASFQQIFEFLK